MPAAAAVAALVALTVGVPATVARAAGPSLQVTATRTFVDADGTRHEVSSNNVSMTVSQTSNLRGRQEVTVRWAGAHPTGGIVADVNSAAGANQEYPFVILQCRGTDSTSVPAAQRVRPETCWTQTWSERFQSDDTNAYPAWRSDLYAPAGDRGRAVNAPDPRPAQCFAAAYAERWVPLVGADGSTYAGGSVGCAGQAPESADVDGAGLPSNATYGVTGKDGTGSAQFGVWTSDENATLGCTSSVACTLVAIPIVGVSCDAYGTALPAETRPSAKAGQKADALCRAKDVYAPGAAGLPSAAPNPATAGALWWSASNWDNRMSVPLSFAPSAGICSVVSDSTPLPAYGSILMNEVAAQWQPKFCTDKALYPFVHVQTSDAAARTLLTNRNIDVAFGSRPPDTGGARPTVQAPVALSGWAVSYAIDDAQGNRYTSLRLNARLIAKLLTQSYPGTPLVRDNYRDLSNNPMNITQDPEFLALNPGLPTYAAVEAASTIINLSTEADLVYALTSWLDADPEARAWLDGKADPWGMVVNPNYDGIDLPVESWPLLDDFQLPQSYIDRGNNPCYSYSPSPYLSLIANPTGFISTIVQDVQYAISNVNTACPNGDPNDISTLRLRTQGRQQPGYRFVLGITPVSAAQRYNLATAALQTTSTVPRRQRFTDASGRTFVQPDSRGLRAAAALLKADDDAKTWTLGYDAFHTDGGRAGYPGTMLVSADVPTAGVPKQTALRAATLLRYAAGDGQRSGTANGQLPAGYLPLTKASGLGALSAYTLRAAAAVAAQRGDVPGLRGDTAATAAPSAGSSTTSPAAAGPAGAAVVPPAAPTTASAAATNPADVPVADTATTVSARTAGSYSRLGGLAMPAVLVLALAATVAAAALRRAQWWPHVAAGSRVVARRARATGLGRRAGR